MTLALMAVGLIGLGHRKRGTA
ncbi:MAG: hypothetical protein JRH16_16545 [Deltaproteobacteria bacterium]|nr:hypothetical protein [Deltaproteobacteria bacterium]MBW2421201.1 hypothetical protein [Deltaproteobacteria bacterium]